MLEAEKLGCSKLKKLWFCKGGVLSEVQGNTGSGGSVVRAGGVVYLGWGWQAPICGLPAGLRRGG